MNNCHFIDSETFRYDSEDHKILRTLLAPQDPGNYLMTVCGDTYYVWEVTETMKWIQWYKYEGMATAHFLQLEREHLPDIRAEHDGFYAYMEHRAFLGSEIGIVPRSCYPLNDYVEKWIVDLGLDTCTFYVLGKERVGWMARHARFDKPLIIALRKFQEAVI